MDIGEAIRIRRKALKLTLEQVAYPAGTDTGNLSRIERGIQAAGGDLLQRIIAVLGLSSVGELFNTDISSAAKSGSLSDVSPEAYAPRQATEVPVVGTTQGGPPDRIWDELNFPVGYSDEYLEVSTPDPHAYALRVVGSSMAPRIMEGEWLLVEPTGEVQAGDDVIVKTADGRVMVKTLMSTHGGTVILASVNEAYDRLSVACSEIEFMHFVAGRFASRYVKRRIADQLAPAQQPLRRIAQVDHEGEERRHRQPYSLANAPRYDESGRLIKPPAAGSKAKTRGQ